MPGEGLLDGDGLVPGLFTEGLLLSLVEGLVVTGGFGLGETVLPGLVDGLLGFVVTGLVPGLPPGFVTDGLLPPGLPGLTTGALSFADGALGYLLLNDSEPILV